MDTKLYFDVHPSVVYQLGESLISDSIQALIELVKNSYDADATFSKVIIDTNNEIEIKDTYFPSGKGRIIIEDDGNGMDIETIKTGWFLISNRKKLDLKKNKETTPGGRTPLGDKGLGRLGTQRLGDNLEIYTKCEDGKGYHFGFSWLDFATAPLLKDVDIHFNECELPQKKGTRLVISDLNDIDIWKGQVSIEKLQKELSQMISPYISIRDFNILVQVDGKRFELVELTESVRELAHVRYKIDFNGSELTVQGKVRIDYFRPDNAKGSEEFALLVESDNGLSFYEYINSDKKAKSLAIKKSKSSKWYIEFSQKWNFDDIDKIERNKNNNGVPYNPGPFFGEIDSFDLGQSSYQNQNVFNKISEFREYIKSLSGIRVYRDGFAIRVDHDWLKLGAQWTSAGSYYGLKPDNTLGYIALTARDNIELEETTDREGFKDTQYFRNFYLLLTEFRKITENAHDFFRRSFNEYRKNRNEKLSQLESSKSIEDISKSLRKKITVASTHRKNVEDLTVKISHITEESHALHKKISKTDNFTPQIKDQISKSLSDLETVLVQAQKSLPILSKYLNELDSFDIIGQVLEDRVDSLRRQMGDMYETVALGITAEALSHEIFNIADQLALRAKSAERKVHELNIKDRIISSFIENVHSTVIALRKQLAFLSPALRYVREKRELIKLNEFINELNIFYTNRLQKNNIKIQIINSNVSDFQIKMNKGKLTQIIDNFVLNSEYWLKEDIRSNKIDNGIINFDLSKPFLRIWDNGRGIDHSVENTLFEPFVTAKSREQGRGLGLFIIKQLLDSEGCSVGLMPERNKYKRYFKFQVDFRGDYYE
ncbi:MAG TPA: ATP-binding protein [Spirochaetota bacterium]|nr:ATP-binding protein [Spirochaetota bacterium]HNT13130.1 ATP-binding protein [Spirochaetota bacterium]